jgi:hypothetical protein
MASSNRMPEVGRRWLLTKGHWVSASNLDNLKSLWRQLSHRWLDFMGLIFQVLWGTLLVQVLLLKFLCRLYLPNKLAGLRVRDTASNSFLAEDSLLLIKWLRSYNERWLLPDYVTMIAILIVHIKKWSVFNWVALVSISIRLDAVLLRVEILGMKLRLLCWYELRVVGAKLRFHITGIDWESYAMLYEMITFPDVRSHDMISEFFVVIQVLSLFLFLKF